MSYIIFARWFGFISTILSIGILFNLDDAKIMAKNMADTDSGYIMGGVLPIIFGSLAFMQHSIFNFSWQLVITLISLFMLAIGIFRVLFVRHWKALMHRHLDKIPALFSLFGLMFGLLLIYVGYIAPIVDYKPNLTP